MENKKYQLPREFATKWIEALRSGEYKQTVGGHLHDRKGYCCLGVACKIEGVRVFKDAQWIGDNRTFKSLGKYTTVPNSIPPLLIGTCATSDFIREVSQMNDGGKTFSQIAKWITENVEFI